MINRFWWLIPAALGIAVVVVSVIAIRTIDKRANALMVQCLADGHKEYECAYLRSTPYIHYSN